MYNILKSSLKAFPQTDVLCANFNIYLYVCSHKQINKVVHFYVALLKRSHKQMCIVATFILSLKAFPQTDVQCGNFIITSLCIPTYN